MNYRSMKLFKFALAVLEVSNLGLFLCLQLQNTNANITLNFLRFHLARKEKLRFLLIEFDINNVIKSNVEKYNL